MDNALRPAQALNGLCKVTLIIGSSDRRDSGKVNSLYAYDLLDHKADLLRTEGDYLELLEGDHTKATYRCGRDVLKLIPEGSHLDVVTKLGYVTTELNRPALLRQNLNYQHSNCNGLLADYEILLEIDELLLTRNLSVFARPPIGVGELARYEHAKGRARDRLRLLLSAGPIS